MSQSTHPYANEGYALMGAAFEVHNVLGRGLSEEINQQSLEMELGLRKIPYRRKHQLVVFHKGQVLETCYIPDLVVHDRIIVELKSVAAMCPAHESQLLNYLRIAR